jgi:hypothetical protein
MLTNEIKEVGLLCKEFCQQTKEIEGITMKCGIGRYNNRSIGYVASTFCGNINCLSISQKKEENWFRCEQNEKTKRR